MPNICCFSIHLTEDIASVCEKQNDSIVLTSGYREILIFSSLSAILIYLLSGDSEIQVSVDFDPVKYLMGLGVNEGKGKDESGMSITSPCLSKHITESFVFVIVIP